MKYALLTDNSVQWFTYLVSITDIHCTEYYRLDSGINNDFLSNIFRREMSFSNLRLIIPNSCMNTFYGSWISPYDFDRIRKMIELWPKVKEYKRLGELE